MEESAPVTGSLHATLFQNFVTSHPWYHNKPLNRKDIVLINRICSNHYHNLNYSLFRLYSLKT